MRISAGKRRVRWVSVAVVGGVMAVSLARGAAGQIPYLTYDGAPAYSLTIPDELQFTCVPLRLTEEDDAAAALTGHSWIAPYRAAQILWRGHSRPHAAEVLKYLAEQKDDKWVSVVRDEVEAGLRPEAIRKELAEGDYRWGAWCAFLRPNKEFVPLLLAALKDEPELLPETTLALGASRDPRAFKPLMELLKKNDYEISGYAAQALGYFGGPDVEGPLLEALARSKVWQQMKTCEALGRCGTARAIPALRKLAESDAYTGAINVRGVAKRAIDSIAERQQKAAAPRP